MHAFTLSNVKAFITDVFEWELLCDFGCACSDFENLKKKKKRICLVDCSYTVFTVDCKVQQFNPCNVQTLECIGAG